MAKPGKPEDRLKSSYLTTRLPARILGGDELTASALISSPWTRSPARMRFKTLVQQSIERGTQQAGYLFAVLYADLDRFAVVNDSLGKEAGDELLAEVTRRLRGCLPEGDDVVRLREDEYLVFLDRVRDFTSLQERMDKLNNTLRPVFRLKRNEVFTSACMGIALGPHGYTQAEEMVKDAETAMHRSKSKGPGSFEIFEARLHDEAKVQLTLETQLRRALEQQQFRLEYEPIVSLGNDRLAGFESLLRWQHPERGLVYPGEFLPAAEETGLIVPITQWVLQEACQRLKKWQSELSGFSSLWLSINFSPAYMQKSDFAGELSASVAQSGVDSSQLVVEITENQLLKNADSILRSFAILHDTGIKLWIDDFGAGYSSLAYLVNFPIHSLKIDRSFVSASTRDHKSAVITKAIVSLGKALDINVIAEGMETKEQLEYLLSIGCPHAQGHYYSRSIDGETIENIYGVKR